ncbi:MAG: DUF6155 family protein [Flavobacteriaceae bacterium]|nr:DUF6155 family protein [Flavobacteriaceae bacterium]
MGLRELNKELKQMEKTEIIKMVSELYKSVPMAKEYLDVFATGNIKQLIEKYKFEIEDYVYPKGREMLLREKEARKLIRTIRKMKVPELTVTLELHYVYCCLDIIEDFGYWDEPYYNAVTNMFYSATKGVIKGGFEKKFDKLITNLVSRSYEYGLDFEY